MSLEIDVEVQVPVYEVDDEPVSLSQDKVIVVRSDGNSSWVQLQFEEGGKRYTVSGRELRAAVERCERNA